MDQISYKTVYANPETVKKEWLLVDAENEVVGRLASRIAYLLRGKHKTSFTPHTDAGDNVVVINAHKVRFTGKKMAQKVYLRHTGYHGGQRSATPKEVLNTHPERILEHAIKAMLPKTKLGDQVYRSLFVYASDKHPHEAQQPKTIDVKSLK